MGAKETPGVGVGRQPPMREGPAGLGELRLGMPLSSRFLPSA